MLRQASPLTKLPEPANLDQFKVGRRDEVSVAHSAPIR
jgi:hypothetical protein